MRILQVTHLCHVDSIGGTQRYLYDLSRALDGEGIDAQIGYIDDSHGPHPFVDRGITIVPLSPSVDAGDLLGTAPDWVHFHTLGDVELRIAEAARELGIKGAYTHHTAVDFCRVETLLRGGHTPCDGTLRTTRCNACIVETRTGVPMPFSMLGAMLPPLASLAARLPLLVESRLRHVVTPRWIERRRRFLASCDMVVAVAPRSRSMLIANGARETTLVDCAQGVSSDFGARRPRNESKRDRCVIGCVGRLTKAKGIDLLLESFARVDDPRARLVLVGQPENDALRDLIRADSRVELRAAKRVDDATLYDGLDVIAIPSIGFETGPLALFEAAQLGIPILVSSRTGQPELARAHGTVVEPTIEAWTQALIRATEQVCRGGHESGPPVRSMKDVGREMAAHYRGGS